MGDTPGALSGPSTYPCAIEMPYSQTYILETVSGLEHLPDVNEAHLKSSVGSYFWPVWGSKAAEGPYNEAAVGRRLENFGV